jgi:LmbE family N-acetylglucosaminyl deacetylase
MIVSVVNEAEWLAALTPLPVWKPPETPILFVAPHPDDESLAAGGLIRAQTLRGFDVTVAAVTDGENAYEGVEGLGVVRRMEQTKALGRLGVPSERIIRFGLPDSDLAPHKERLVRELLKIVSPDTHLIAPWKGDFHPDHEVCGRAAAEVARQTGAKLTFYFFWSWHFGTFSLISHLPLRRFPLTPDLLRAKSDALACHRSQLIRQEGDPILPESLLAPARRPFEIFATE